MLLSGWTIPEEVLVISWQKYKKVNRAAQSSPLVEKFGLSSSFGYLLSTIMRRQWDIKKRAIRSIFTQFITELTNNSIKYFSQSSSATQHGQSCSWEGCPITRQTSRWGSTSRYPSSSSSPSGSHQHHHHPNKVLGGLWRHRGGRSDHRQKYREVSRIRLCE